MDESTGKAKTAEHYSKQWGAEFDFHSFIESNPDAAQAMTARVMPWDELIDAIREEATRRTVSVYEGACGYGDMARRLLAEPCPEGLQYLGVDIHGSLAEIDAPARAEIMQWDMSQPLPDGREFDFVISREAVHHTPDPAETCAALTSHLRSGGTFAMTVYAKKAPMREACDDALRSLIVPMPNDEALRAARQFTQLGRDLQNAAGEIEIAEDLPLLGIKAGRYSIQSFIYDYFLKCWYNAAFSKTHCDLVNYDWYHPPYAYRFTLDEARALAEDCGLTIGRTVSIPAQHYIEAKAT